jgi:hypothetical protein
MKTFSPQNKVDNDSSIGGIHSKHKPKMCSKEHGQVEGRWVWMYKTIIFLLAVETKSVQKMGRSYSGRAQMARFRTCTLPHSLKSLFQTIFFFRSNTVTITMDMIPSNHQKSNCSIFVLLVSMNKQTISQSGQLCLIWQMLFSPCR